MPKTPSKFRGIIFSLAPEPDRASVLQPGLVPGGMLVGRSARELRELGAKVSSEIPDHATWTGLQWVWSKEEL